MHRCYHVRVESAQDSEAAARGEWEARAEHVGFQAVLEVCIPFPADAYESFECGEIDNGCGTSKALPACPFLSQICVQG